MFKSVEVSDALFLLYKCLPVSIPLSLYSVKDSPGMDEVGEKYRTQPMSSSLSFQFSPIFTCQRPLYLADQSADEQYTLDTVRRYPTDAPLGLYYLCTATQSARPGGQAHGR